MKLVTFRVTTPVGPQDRLGILLDDSQNGRIVDVTTAYAEYLKAETDEPTPEGLAHLRTPPDMIGWLRGGRKSREAADAALDYVRGLLVKESDPRASNGATIVYKSKSVRLLAPIPRPHSIRDCSIYLQHMMRAGKRSEKRPAWYTNPPYYKGNPDAVVGPGEDVPFPYYTQKLDLEIELGIIVGKVGRNLTVAQAREHIAGFTILIDPSARDGHERESFGPTKRKDFATGLGPCIVTCDAIEENNLKVKVTCDGETWFEGNTGEPRSFLPEQLVAYISDSETIHPGDVIGTGTIGFGCSMDYHKWPQVGQVMTFEIEGIGIMSHRIVAGEHVVDHVLGMKGLIEKPPAKVE
ncbi:MAG TPA: fumarylacetoacetate hydrolase family protein [Beijerinckiaceae bacterium]|nr:fumarylacetoacetate hydrolase family protein [Beijerinckiaceae bacterium]